MERKIEFAKMLIKFYNLQAGTSFRCNNEGTQATVIECINDECDNISDIKNHIRDCVKDKIGFKECFSSYRCPVKEVAPVTQPQVTEQAVTSSLGILEQAVVQMISTMQSKKIEQNIMGTVEDKIRQFIKDEYGTIERKVNVIVNDKKAEMQGVVHDKFDTVLKFVANDEPVYLAGPAGSGKNVLCKQIAEALGLEFYFTNAVTQEYQLKGFTDAMGNYQETQFYKAFTEGGVFMLDEMDASIPETLIILNSAIANRYFDFPAPIGKVEAHPDFRVISAGNTFGSGATIEYNGRNQLDGASLDRFAIIEIDYSESIENNVALGNIELADFCRDFRKSAKKAGLNVIVSYRGIGRLAKMEQLLSVKEALQTCLVKGLEADDINIICKGLQRESKYKTALQELVSQL